VRFLASRGAFLIPLERTVLVAHPRLGRFTGADFERFRSGGPAEDGYGLFRAALEDLPPEVLDEATQRLQSIEDGFRRADAVFTREAAGDVSPNFTPTYETLARLRKAIAAFGSQAEEDGVAEDADTGQPASQAASGGRSLSGRVDSRDDVLRALDAIVDYYRRQEPASPIPLLMERAKHWVKLDFMSLMKDLAPDGVSQAIRVLSKRDDDDD